MSINQSEMLTLFVMHKYQLNNTCKMQIQDLSDKRLNKIENIIFFNKY